MKMCNAKRGENIWGPTTGWRCLIIRRVFLFLSLSASLVCAQSSYVTTIPPFTMILREIIGDRNRVYGLLPPGASPHTFDPVASDIIQVERAKALILGGPNLDRWALKFGNTKSLELLPLLPPAFLLDFEGSVHDHSSGDQSNRHLHASGVDPHFWTDPLAVKSLLPSLTDSLCAMDPENAAVYRSNSRSFANQLDSLNDRLQARLGSVVNRSVVLSHPFFRYFFRRYNFDLVEIIEKQPGTEPTPREIKRLVRYIVQRRVKAIFTHPQLSDRPSRLIAEITGIEVYELDPLGGGAGRDRYADLLLYNAGIVIRALQ
jgi:ABC-type Zn uptake system ZnuABC Zn-binding protein ZnuA